MKITENQLRKMIKETILKENYLDAKRDKYSDAFNKMVQGWDWSEYRYGKKSNALIAAKRWLQQNPDKIREEPIDYPDYYGMPSNIANKLSSDEVDYLQGETVEMLNLTRLHIPGKSK